MPRTFVTAGVQLLQGRAFTDDEARSGAPVVLVSQSVARDFFGGADPIGRTLSGVPTPFGEEAQSTIIGIVADAMMSSPEANRNGALYFPMGSRFDNPPTLIVRSQRPAAIVRSAETALLAVNPGVRATGRVVGAAAQGFLDNTRRLALMAASVAGLACVLAILGIYGVTAFVLKQRTQEIGVRLTLGATSGELFGLLVRQSLRPVVIGLAVGLAAALGCTEILASLLWGLSPYDPLSIGLAVSVLLAGAFGAVVGPVRLAARTDPAGVLRSA